MLIRFLIPVLCVSLFSGFSAAQETSGKEVGGGSGSNGRILDREIFEKGERLNGAELLKLLQTEFQKEFAMYPVFRHLGMYYLVDSETKKDWYLDDRAFPKGCINRASVDVAIEDWACQDRLSVRIRPAFWKKANNSVRADLILHEILTAMRLLDPKVDNTFTVVAPAFYALTDAKMTHEQRSDEWRRLGFGELFTAGEIAQVDTKLREAASVLCKLVDADQAGGRIVLSKGMHTELTLAAWDLLEHKIEIKESSALNLLLNDAVFEMIDSIQYWNGCDILSTTIPVLIWDAWFERHVLSRYQRKNRAGGL